MENKELFDEEKELEEIKELEEEIKAVEATQGQTEQKPESSGEEVEEADDLIDDDFEIELSDKSQKQIEEERGVRKIMNGATLTIKEVFVKKPITYNLVDGAKVRVPPKVSKNGKVKYYSTKLQIKFEEQNLTEYVPTVAIFIGNDGRLNKQTKLDRKGNTKVSQLVRLTLQHMSNNAFNLETKKINERDVIVVTEDTKPVFEEFSKKVSDQELMDYLKGKKVEIETATGEYEGRQWFRNDIVKIIG